MRRILILLLGICAFATQAVAQAASPSAQRFQEILREVVELHRKQQYADALTRLKEAEALKVNDVLVNNIRGSTYTAMRDFPKARASFEASLKLKPDAYESRYNLVELDFVEGKYAEAEAGFANLLRAFPKLTAEPRQLAQFKLVLCQLKQNKTEAAAASVQTFAFPETSPAHFSTQAALALHKNDSASAMDWMNKATKSFQKGEMVPYIDSLVEAKWLNVSPPSPPKK
jgi:tetratricopeptide (TPR) repeat protein